MPTGGARKAARAAADEASEQLGRQGARQAARKADGNLPAYFSRYMSQAELEAVMETGFLRGWKPGTDPGITYFTTNRFRKATRAQQLLALPVPPQVRVDFQIINQPSIFGPRKVSPNFGQPGGGIEYYSPDPVQVRIIRTLRLE